MRVYDYECTHCALVQERFVLGPNTRTVKCRGCAHDAKRLICAPMFRLPGDDPAGFPTAYDKWGKDHERGAKLAAKKNEGYNE